MRTQSTPSANRSGMTLVEFLGVLVVIGILAYMLVPALSGGGPAMGKNVRVEAANLAYAINQYYQEYGKYPVSDQVARSVNASVPDFTFGTYACRSPGNARSQVMGSLPPLGDDTAYRTSNAELIAVLRDLEKFRDGTPTVNAGHKLNPKNICFLNVKDVEGKQPGGVGGDGVYRDPWGTPFIVTIDLNGDGKARDAFYRKDVISAGSQPGRVGLYGLERGNDAKDTFEINAPVVVWSFGPDREISFKYQADGGPNRDNVISWR